MYSVKVGIKSCRIYIRSSCFFAVLIIRIYICMYTHIMRTFIFYDMCMCIHVYIVSDPSQVVNYYYTCLESHMDADSVSHMMHYKHLITDDDYEAITAAPNDSKMNTVILQYVRAMDINQLNKFCDVLKSIETQKNIGDCLSTGKYQ